MHPTTFTQPRSTCARTWKVSAAVMGTMFLAVVLSITASLLSASFHRTEAANTPPFVATPIGRYVGVVITSENFGKSYVAFRSIPFAKPPIGDFRFQRPRPLDTPGSNLQVNSEKYKPSCLTATKLVADKNYGEDCLYLNVYVPGDGQTRSDAAKLPVMVWIHGGGFVAGTTFPEPEKLVTKGDLIVVTVNYRLGVFGFLSTEDDVVKGNAGLWDQYMAMKWVKENIRYFNGDDNSITLFGESAGAMSTAIHVLSPISSNLFNKAILQSGSATSMISRDAKQRAIKLGSMFGCKASSHDLVKCLKQVDPIELLKRSRHSEFDLPSAQKQADFLWMPVIDGEYILKEPLPSLKDLTYMEGIGAFAKDYMLGLVSNEGSLVAENFLNKIPLRQLSNASFISDLTDYLLYARYGPGNTHNTALKDAIYKFYFGSANLNSELNPENVMDLAGDLQLVVPTVETALVLSGQRKATPACPLSLEATDKPDIASKSGKVYVYHFDFCPPKDPCRAQCTAHGDDVAYMFPRSPFKDPVQQELSDIFVDLLTTFASKSAPEVVPKSGWPIFDGTTQNYLRIDNEPSVRRNPYHYRMTFWLDVVPGLLQNKGRTHG